MKGKEAIHNKNIKDNYATPRPFIQFVKDTFYIHRFSLDAAASKRNAAARRFFTKKDNALKKNWYGFAVWLNPPYSKCDEFVTKAIQQRHNCEHMFILLPARTDQPWYHALIDAKADFYPVKGRIKFEGAESGAPFPSILVLLSSWTSGKTRSLCPSSYERGGVFKGKKENE